MNGAVVVVAMSVVIFFYSPLLYRLYRCRCGRWVAGHVWGGGRRVWVFVEFFCGGLRVCRRAVAFDFRGRLLLCR